MSGGYSRNFELSRAAMVMAAGGALIGLNQQLPGTAPGLAAMAMVGLGGLGVAGGLILAIRALTKRQGGADQ